MNEEIRKIVSGYISEGDYEKALSLLTNLPLEDDADKALLESCKKDFASSCTTAITEAVKAKDKQKAKSILSSYKKLIGEDANTTLFQTLVDSIQKEETLKQTETLHSKSSISLSDLFENCAPDKNFLRSKVMCGAYALLAIIAIVCGSLCEPSTTLCLSSVFVSISLAIPVLKSSNRRFKPIGLVLLLIPIITTIALYGGGIDNLNINVARSKLSFPTIPWLTSFIFIVVYNIVLNDKSWTYRIVESLLLYTIFNPEWYGMIVPLGVWEYEVHEGPYHIATGIHYYDFRWDSNELITISLLFTLFIYYCSLIGFKTIWNKIKQYKKIIGIVAGTLIGLLIIFVIIKNIKDAHDQKVAHRQAIEKAHRDSIQAVEQARISAIEQARKDSIAAVRKQEQARRDSIDYAEHGGFVSKYANIGLIISNLEMTRGQNSDGVSTKGIKFTVFNPTHKTIKYVIVNVHAVNKFNDRVSYNESCRGMGPIDPHEYGSWDFNDVFTDKNDIIDDLSVSFQVEYTNGSSKTIRWKDAYVSDFKTLWFNGR